LSDNEKPSIDKIIAVWKANCGETKHSEKGTTYVVVPIPDRYTHLLNLIQTLLDHGYDKECIESGSLRGKVVLACWSDLIIKISAKDLRRNRAITASQWDEAVNKFSDITISKFVEPEKEVPVQKVEIKKESLTEEKMEELANLAQKLKNDPNRSSPNLSEEVEELDTDFLELMGLPIPDGTVNE
jgi:hypothetical protein